MDFFEETAEDLGNWKFVIDKAYFY